MEPNEANVEQNGIERQNSGQRLLKFLLFIFFLFCYLEWPGDHHEFIFQLEYEILFMKAGVESIMHPLILFPFIGQLLLGISIFSRGNNRKLTLTAIALLGVLVLLLFIVGLLSMNIKIIASVMPFMFSAVIYFRITRPGNERTVIK